MQNVQYDNFENIVITGTKLNQYLNHDIFVRLSRQLMSNITRFGFKIEEQSGGRRSDLLD